MSINNYIMSSLLKKGGIAILDQVLFSGSNFLLNIYLVKLLTPADYGLFGTLYSIYILICIIFTSIFLEPYIYYKNTMADSNSYTKLYSSYYNLLLFFSFFITVLGLILTNYILIYFSFIIITCVIYFYKRHFLAILSPKYSLKISMSYCFFLLLGLFMLEKLYDKNLFNAFLVLNISSFICISPVIFFTPSFRTLLFKIDGYKEFIGILSKQKKYAFHCITSGVLSWIPSNIYFVLLPLFYSKELNAELKALQNIALPITHLNIAIVSLLVPMFINALNPFKLIKQISLLFIALPLLYLFFVLTFSNYIELYIYNNKYSIDTLLISGLLIGIIPEIISNVFKAFFRSIEKPENVTKINLFNAILSIFCIYFVYYFGLKGVIISYFAINCFNMICSIYFFISGERLNRKNYYKLV